VATLGGLVAIAFALFRFRIARAIALLALALALTPAALGVVARQLALRTVEGVLAGGAIDPAQAARIRAQGEIEAGRCVDVGATTGSPTILFALVAVGLAFALKPKEA